MAFEVVESSEDEDYYNVTMSVRPEGAFAGTAGREQFRAYFTGYFATPVYNKFLAWFGYEEAAHSLREGWREKDRARTAAAMSDELIDRIAVIGDADRCRDLVREYLAEGITTPVINPISNDPAQIAATFEAFTPENFPL